MLESTDEVSLLDIWALLVKFKKTFWSIFTAICLIGLGVTFLSSQKYKYSQTIFIASYPFISQSANLMAANNVTAAVESADNVLAKLKMVFLPDAIKAYKTTHPSVNLIDKDDFVIEIPLQQVQEAIASPDRISISVVDDAHKAAVYSEIFNLALSSLQKSQAEILDMQKEILTTQIEQLQNQILKLTTIQDKLLTVVEKLTDERRAAQDINNQEKNEVNKILLATKIDQINTTLPKLTSYLDGAKSANDVAVLSATLAIAKQKFLLISPSHFINDQIEVKRVGIPRNIQIVLIFIFALLASFIGVFIADYLKRARSKT